jgi:hypothetical protein
MASDIMSCLFLNYNKKSVMQLAIPVAVKFLHKGNKDLSRWEGGSANPDSVGGSRSEFKPWTGEGQKMSLKGIDILGILMFAEPDFLSEGLLYHGKFM